MIPFSQKYKNKSIAVKSQDGDYPGWMKGQQELEGNSVGASRS